MSYLAVDLGNKRVGIAVSTENIAFPHSIITRVELVSWLKKYLDTYIDVDTIIV
jgi:RNase H-fold protein (predicted Holliday junction resolvase)